MRFITIPEPILVSFGNGKILITLAEVIKGLFADQRTTEMFDRAQRKAIRKLPWSSDPGTVIEISDESWSKLEVLTRSPRLLTAVLDADSDAGDPLLGAISDAPTKDPRLQAPEKETKNGKLANEQHPAS